MRPTTKPQVKITLGDQTLTVVEHLHPLAYLARVYEVGSNGLKDAYLTTGLDDAYDFLDENIGEGQYGDVAVYDISFSNLHRPSMIRTLPARRVPQPPE